MGKKDIEYYSEEEIRKAAEGAGSVSEVMRIIGVIPAGANHRIFKKRLIDLGIRLNGKIKTHNNCSGLRIPRNLCEFLVKNGPRINSFKLKKMLFKEGLKFPLCEWCGLGDVWNGKSLIHHLDHKDGSYYNNEIDNLRILCPNCHSQTETYCKGGKRCRGKIFRSIENKEKICSCGDKVEGTGELCQKCRRVKIEKHLFGLFEIRGLNKEDFILCLNNRGILAASVLMGVSNHTVRRWLKDGIFGDSIRISTLKKNKMELESKGVTLEFLESEVDKWGYEEVGRSLGVTGNTIKNWIKREKNRGS
jgi:hypothetical protein